VIEVVKSATIYPWWDLIPSVVGALVGAAAAAIPAYYLAKSSSREAVRRDRISRRDRQKAAAVQGTVKLLIITNDLENIYNHLEGLIERSHEAGRDDMQIWQIITPMVAIEQSKISFNPEELSVFIENHDFDILNDVLLLSNRYWVFKDSMQEYSRRRQELTDMLPAQMEGAQF